MKSRSYKVGRSRITLTFGNLVESKAEVIVSSDDYMLSMGGGVSAAIRAAGGPQVMSDATKLVPAAAGDVLVSSAGDLPAKYILHAVTIGPHQLALPPEALIRQVTKRVLTLVGALGCRSVAFPAIGAGVAGVSYEVVASQMAGVLVEFLLDADEHDVELFLFDRWHNMSPEDFFMFFEAFAARTLGLSSSVSQHTASLLPPAAPGASVMGPDAIADAERRHQVFLMLRHLDGRRNRIEAELLQTLGAEVPDDGGSLERLRQQLEKVQDLRRGYEAELACGHRAVATGAPNSVFVSSTSADLQPHRQAVRAVIDRMQLRFIGMEEFSATGQAPVDLIRRKVQESQVYLGILGMRYGCVDPGTGLSMTELEYRQAIASDKKLCMFVMDMKAPIQAGMMEDDPVRYAKLVDLKGRVMKAHTCVLYTDSDNLAAKAEATLRESFAS